jgi:hypothetical protein
MSWPQHAQPEATAPWATPVHWHALGAAARHVLARYATGPASRPYASDLPALRSLAKDGLVAHDAGTGLWRATDLGREVYAKRGEVAWP